MTLRAADKTVVTDGRPQLSGVQNSAAENSFLLVASVAIFRFGGTSMWMCERATEETSHETKDDHSNKVGHVFAQSFANTAARPEHRACMHPI